MTEQAHWIGQLRRLNPCPEALAWAADLLTNNPDTTLAKAWLACQNPDWLDWVVGQISTYWRDESWARSIREKSDDASLEAGGTLYDRPTDYARWLAAIRKHISAKVFISCWSAHFRLLRQRACR